MGDVFLAEDPQMDRKVVIKLAKAAVGDVRNRFAQEVALFARIRSPRISDLRVRADRETPYLVFEYIEGLPLDRILKQRGRISPDDALNVLEGLAEGLAVAHENQVIHRDIKPSNVILRNGEL